MENNIPKKIQKVLLINPVLSFFDDKRKIEHLGLAYISASLKNKGINCDIIDFQSIDTDDMIKYVLNIIENNNYEVIGISVLFFTEKKVLSICKEIKERFNVYIVLGGIQATINHATLIKNDFVDYVIRGDGEVAFCNIINHINGDRKKLIGCTYKDGQEIVITHEINYVENLNELPFPTRSGISNIIPISSSRGCVYSCSFCCIPSVNSKWRIRSSDNIALEVFRIFQNNVNLELFYVDDNFLLDIDRGIDIAKKIKEKCGKVIPFTFATRSDQLNRAGIHKLSLLKKLGCKMIELGIENGSNSVLKRYNKQLKIEDNLLALNLLDSCNIDVYVDYILFDGFISIDELKENIVFLKKSLLWGFYPPVIYTRAFPFQGTQIEESYAKKEKYFSDKNVELIYEKMQAFKKNIQTLIDQLLIDLPSNYNIERTWLLSVPYDYFEGLVVGEYIEEKEIIANINLIKNMIV
mgnify:CR=1 FL=1